MRTKLVAFAALGAAACTEVAEPEMELEHVGTVESALTVEQAVTGGCSTKSVEALSKQIIAQANCIAAGAFVAVPKRPNATFGAAVFPYMQEPARDALLGALDGSKGTTMTVNSMLRSVAQQYLLYRWYQTGSCGIGLAAKPGSSNHETGLAIDIQEYATWRTKLEAKGFAWLGSSDPVHFDYKGPGSVNQAKVGVQAFQQLWNKNNPGDPIDEDGIYGPQTEARLKKSPVEGFAIGGGDCGTGGGGGAGGGSGEGGAGGGSGEPTEDALELGASFTDAADDYADGPSKAVPDLVAGRTYTLEVTATNGGASVPALDVEVSLPGGLATNGAGTTTVSLPAAGAGETARATLTVSATGYTVTQVAPAEIRLAAGDVTASAKVDVYSPRRWEFDGERLEGWTSTGKLSVTSTAEMGDAASDGELVLSGASSTLTASSPAVDVATAGLGALVLRARRLGGTGKPVLYLDETPYELDLPADGELHDVTLEESRLPATVTTIRFAPFEGGDTKNASAALAFLRLGDDRGLRSGDEGCGCRMVGGTSSASLGGLALAGLGALLLRRRRSTSP